MCIYKLRIYELGFTNYEFTSCELPRPLPPPRKRGGGFRLRPQCVLFVYSLGAAWRPYLLAFVCVLGGWLVGIEVLEEFLKLVEVGDEHVASFGTFVGTYDACGFELVGEFACSVVSYLEGAL